MAHRDGGQGNPSRGGGPRGRGGRGGGQRGVGGASFHRGGGDGGPRNSQHHQPRGHGGAAGARQERFELFVRNLPPACTQEELRQAFEGMALSSVRLPVDKDTGEPKQFAFVELLHRRDVSRVLSRPSTVIRNRELAISLTDAGREVFSRGLQRIRVGVYFGSFDPIHENHAGLAEYVLSHNIVPVTPEGPPSSTSPNGGEKVPLDHIVLVPNPDQPSKPFLSPLAVRARMLRARFPNNERIHVFDQVDGMVVNWNGRGTLCSKIATMFSLGQFPVSKVAAAAEEGEEQHDEGEEQEPEVRFAVDIFQIIGQDSFSRKGAQTGLLTPHILKSLNRKFLVFPREGESEDVAVDPALRDRTIVVRDYRDPIELSSTAIRRHFAKQAAESAPAPESAPPGIHPSVAAVIRELGLYVPRPNNPDAHIVIVMGGPGTGKGTLGNRLRDLFGFTPVSPGEFMRSLKDADPVLQAKLDHLKARDMMAMHNKAVNRIMRALLEHTVKRTGFNRFVFDSIQPESLVDNTDLYGGTPDLVIRLHCAPDIMLDRINRRNREGDTPHGNSERVSKFVSREDDFLLCTSEYEKLLFAKVIHIDTGSSTVDECLASSGLLEELQQLQRDRPLAKPSGAPESLDISYVDVVREALKYVQFPPEIDSLLSSIDATAAAAGDEKGGAAPKEPRGDALAAKVSEHYNKVVRNAEERESSKIKALRNFNNCTKSALIQDSCDHILSVLKSHRVPPTPAESADGGDKKSKGSKDAKGGKSYSAHAASAAAAAAAATPAPLRLELDILDLCCGKGGDIAKLERYLGSYVGADIAAVSVDENLGRARYRFKTRADSLRTDFIATNCCTNRLAPIVEGAQGARHFYHFVNCQFSLHYGFEREDMIRCLLENAASRLARGGRFVATFPNMETLLSRLEAARRKAGNASKVLSFGNRLYNVAFADEPPTAEELSSNPAKAFGIRYIFHLEDAIDDCPEFAVHFPTLERLAGEYGLRVARRMGDLLRARNLPHFKSAEFIYGRMGGVALSPEEEEAVSVYQAVEFEQTSELNPSLVEVSMSAENNATLLPLSRVVMKHVN